MEYLIGINLIIVIFLTILYLVDCTAAIINGSYNYMTPSPASQGSVMSISCAAGYAWTTTPATGARNATCKNVTGIGQWVISGGGSCACMTIFVVFDERLI